MKGNTVSKSRLACRMLAIAAFAVPALAGPPLLCHRFNIGGARSLPWSEPGSSWDSSDPSYNTPRLVDDTLALLADTTPVVVRMETIRRAVLYGGKDASLSRALLDRFRERATHVGRSNALVLFDCGYLIETMKQASMTREMKPAAVAVGGESGYTIIKEALRLRGNDPEMEFAAALVAVWPRQADHEEHFRKAVAGASNDPLLAKNLLEHFPERGRTLSDLQAGTNKLAQRD